MQNLPVELDGFMNTLYQNRNISGTPNTWIYDPIGNHWFKIDTEGFAGKGWYNDILTGNWYFMNIINATMCEGKQIINGKEYYFATFDGGGKVRGQMYVSEMTPIGRYANADGSLK